METPPWYEIGAHVATMLGFVGIIFLFVQHYYDRDVRNLQLMQRCLDGFKEWSIGNKATIDLPYLELLNEELFYIQRGLIDKEVAVEWIEGILDFVAVQGEDGTVLNQYNQQPELDKIALWQSKKYYFRRIHFFVHTKLHREMGGSCF